MRAVGVVLLERHREVLALPAPGVGQVVELHGGLGREHRAEGVAHHGKLRGLLRAERLLHRARVRAVRDALRVHRDGALLDALARLVIALDVVEDLVAVEVRVVVRHRDGVRVEVQEPRAEAADDEVVALERLVDRRRHVQLADDRAEVVDVEAVRVVAAVPAHHVERVVRVGVAVHQVAGLDADLVLALLVVSERELRHAQVALAVGRVLQELAGLLAHVARRRADVAAVGRLEHHEARLLLAVLRLVEGHLVRDALGDHDVVLGPELERAEGGLHRARAEVDEDALVAHGVLEEVVHLLVGDAHGHLHVGVAEEHHAAGDGVALGRHGAQLEVAHAHHVGLDVLGLGAVERLPADHLRGRVDVVERGRGAHEALGAEDFLAVERAVRAAELHVALLGDLAELRVVGHGCG